MRDTEALHAAAPLSGTLGRVLATLTEGSGMDVSARLGHPEEPGWVTAADLYGDSDLLGAVLDRAGREHGPGNRAYTGTSVLRDCLWRTLVPAVGTLLSERRLPDLRATNVGLRFGETGFTEGLSFAAPRFFALPDDPEAGHPDAVVLPSEGCLLGEIRQALSETHLDVLVPALRGLRVRRGKRVLWRAAADVCAEAFVFVGRGLGREAEGVGLAERTLGGTARISAPVNYRVLRYPGGSEATRVRNTCCLYYRVSGLTCFTCPRKTDEERVRQLLEREPEAEGA